MPVPTGALAAMPQQGASNPYDALFEQQPQPAQPANPYDLVANPKNQMIPPPPPMPVPTGALAAMPQQGASNPYDALFEQQPQPAQPANPYDSLFAQPAAPTAAAPTALPVAHGTPPFRVPNKPLPLELGEPRTPAQKVGENIAGLGHSLKATAENFVNKGGELISHIPVLGDAERAGEEIGRHGPEALLAMLANIIPGIVDIPQGAVNLSNQLTRQQQAGQIPDSPIDFTAGIRKSIDMGTRTLNVLAGRDENKPVAVKEAIQRPFDPLLKAYPANAGVGQTLGQLGLGATGKIPGVTLGVMKKVPFAQKMAEGVINAALYGAESNLAEQASERQREQAKTGKIKGLHAQPALKAGVDSMAAGAMFGAAHGIMVNKGNAAKAASEKNATARNPVGDVPDHIEVDGHKVHVDVAHDRLADPNTPQKFKDKVHAALNARDQQIATGAAAPTGEVDAANRDILSVDQAAVDRGLPGARSLTPERSRLNVGGNQMSHEEITEALADPTTPADVKQAIINAITEDAVVAGPSHAEPQPQVWAEGMGPSPDVTGEIARRSMVDQQPAGNTEPRGLGQSSVPQPGEIVPSQMQPFEGFDPNQASSHQDISKAPEQPAAPETSGQAEGQPRYIAQRSADPAKAKAGYHEIIDTETGAIKSSSKRTLGQAQAVSDNLNAGTTKATKGHQPQPQAETPDDFRAQVMENGQAIPDTVAPETRTQLGKLAEAKHERDQAEADFRAAHESFQQLKLIPQDQLTAAKNTRYDARYIEEIERMSAEALAERPENVQLEVQNGKKYQAEPVKLPSDQMLAAQKVHDAYMKLQATNKKYQAARDTVVPRLQSGMESGEIPSSVNIPHIQGDVNIRAVPKQRSPLETEANAVRDKQHVPKREEVNHLITGIKTFLKSFQPSGISQASVLGPLIPKAKLGKRYTTADIEAGVQKAFGSKVDPATEAIAEGALKSDKVKDFAQDADVISRLFTLRRTLDIVKDHSADLHKKIWEGIAKETIFGRGLKFDPSQEFLVDKSLTMTPEAIRTGADGLNVFDSKQRNYLATRRAIRQESAKNVKADMDKIVEYYGDPTSIPGSAKHTLDVLNDLHRALTGASSTEGVNTFGQAGRYITNALYDYVFKWNVPYHALNLLDPLVVGSARAGFMNIVKAKYLLQTDKGVQNFIRSHEAKGPLGELRAETSRLSGPPAKGIEETLYGKTKNALKDFRGKLPDLPSESWNFQDSLAASIMHQGDKIKYKGGGEQYLRDMANSKLSLDETVKGYVEALQSTMDITGTGSMGLDKDPIQANPAMRYVVQFASQPYRVARLLKQWSSEGNYGAIGTFLTAQALFAGRSAINKELEWAMEYGTAETRALLYTVQDVLDDYNPISHIIGRDLVDKMKVDLLPLLSGAQANLIVTQVESLGQALAGRKWDKVGKIALLMGLSVILGGGGAQMGRMVGQAQNAQAGEETVYAHAANPAQGLLGGNSLLGRKKFQGFGPFDAVMNSTLPGKSPRAAAFIKEKRREKAGPTIFGSIFPKQKT